MNKDEKRELRRKRLMDNKAYQTMNGLTRYMDRYYLDALIGIIPGWGDAIALLSVVPFVYFSSRVIKSIPLTLAEGFVDGDETIIKQVNQRAWQSAIVLIVLLLLIVLLIWALVSFGSYLYSLVASIF